MPIANFEDALHRSLFYNIRFTSQKTSFLRCSYITIAVAFVVLLVPSKMVGEEILLNFLAKNREGSATLKTSKTSLILDSSRNGSMVRIP